MSKPNRKELLDQANELGLEFSKNIKTAKLAELISESQSPAMKAEPETADADAPVERIAPSAPMSKSTSLRMRVVAAKKRAFKTSIVTVTNKDSRENDVMTTAPLSFENQHFGLAKNVPLDMPVELEQALIDVAETTMITLHKDEVVAGRRTGNKIPQRVKKYAISYAKT